MPSLSFYLLSSTVASGVSLNLHEGSVLARNASLAGDVRNNIAKDGTRKIKHMVQILMENRPIDHTFGCMAGEGIIGLEGINGSHTLPKDPDDPSKGSANAQHRADRVARVVGRRGEERAARRHARGKRRERQRPAARRERRRHESREATSATVQW